MCGGGGGGVCLLCGQECFELAAERAVASESIDTRCPACWEKPLAFIPRHATSVLEGSKRRHSRAQQFLQDPAANQLADAVHCFWPSLRTLYPAWLSPFQGIWGAVAGLREGGPGVPLRVRRRPDGARHASHPVRPLAGLRHHVRERESVSTALLRSTAILGFLVSMSSLRLTAVCVQCLHRSWVALDDHTREKIRADGRTRRSDRHRLPPRTPPTHLTRLPLLLLLLVRAHPIPMPLATLSSTLRRTCS